MTDITKTVDLLYNDLVLFGLWNNRRYIRQIKPYNVGEKCYFITDVKKNGAGEVRLSIFTSIVYGLSQ